MVRGSALAVSRDTVRFPNGIIKYEDTAVLLIILKRIDEGKSGYISKQIKPSGYKKTVSDSV